MTDIATRRAAFRKLHDSFFVLPNAANAGEAKALADLGFKAIASTSHGTRIEPMPHAQRPVLAAAFQAEPPDAWPAEGHADPDKAFVMHYIGGLVENGAAEWGWLPDGTIELRLFTGAVFHLREAEIERII